MGVEPGVAWPAPAKLNLMLRVVGRRPDGYHLLQTVFQFLDVADQLRFSIRPDGVLRRRYELPGVSEEQDLVMRAAQLLQHESGTSLGADVYLEKHLPMGGGIGGGSSDAATTLVALNRLWGAGWDAERLARLGVRLGADVPIFIHGQSAWAEGVGDVFSAIEVPQPWYLLVIPSCHVATAEIFADPDLTRDSPRITIADFLAGSAQNDCLAVVCRRHPEVAEALDWLGRFAQPRLTGTGGCVFAAFDEPEAARRVLQQLPRQFRGLVARGLNRSPLLEALEG